MGMTAEAMSRNRPSRLAGTWLAPVVLTLALLPLGGRSQAALSLLLLFVAMAVLVAIGDAIIRHGLQSTPEALLKGVDSTALMGFPVIVAAQLVLKLGPGFGTGPSHEILQSLLLLTALASFFVLTRSTICDARALRRVLACLVIIGSLEATYAVLNLLAGNERLLIYQRWAYYDSATGTLVSRNHFAFLMEMLLPAGLAAVALLAEHSRHSAGTSFESEARARQWIATSMVVAMALALIFSRSRMGIASFLCAWLVVSVANRTLRPREGARSKKRRWTGPLLIATVVVAYAAVIGLDPVVERFFHIPQDLEHGRWPIWKATLAMIGDAPIFGHGWGTFEALLPGYRPEPTGFFYDHAHNEYLEVMAESGIVGLSVLAWMIFLFFRRAVTTLSARLKPTERTTLFWLTVAITSVLIHSAADFGLRTPGVAFTFVVLIALYSRVSEEPTLLRDEAPAQGERRGAARRAGKRHGKTRHR